MRTRRGHTIHRTLYRASLSLGLAGVLLALWLGAARWFASPTLPTARAQGIGVITHTTVADFTPSCVSSSNISVGNREGGELHLTASVEDDFDGTTVDTTRWITNISNPEAGPYQSMVMANGLITLDGVYLRSVLTITQLPQFFEARARLMQVPDTSGSVDLGFYREIGPLYNPPWETSSIRLFILGNGDPNDLIVRVRDDGGPIGDYNISDPDETQFHVFRIEWEPNVTRFLIDGELQQTVLSNTTVVTSWVFLYHQDPSFYGSTPTDIDWVRAGQYASSGTFTSCPQDAGQKVQWTTLSWNADVPGGTTLILRVRTSMDGVTWSAWSDPLLPGPNNIPPGLAFARYLQYRVEMSTTNPMFSPEVRDVTLSFAELADLTVSKSASADQVVAGEELTYTIRVTNSGPLNATGVRVTDTLPSGMTLISASPSQGSCTGLTCNLGTPNAGRTATITLRVRVNSSTPDGPLTNTVSVGTPVPDDPANNTASIVTQIQTRADLAVALTGNPDPVLAGTPLTYTVILTNVGTSDARNVQAAFTLPGGVTLLSAIPSQGTCGESSCNLGTLPAGVSATVTMQTRVSPSAPEGTVSAQASATSSTPDPNAGNNIDTESTAIRTQADLAITMSDNPDPVLAGNLLTYTITLANSGPSDARDVQVTLNLPDGLIMQNLSSSQGTCSGSTCNLAAISPGTTARITATTRVRSDVAQGTSLTTIAQVTSSTSDPETANNSATATTRVQTQADLAVALTDNPDPVLAGDLLTYTITLTNTGPSDAQGVWMTPTLPGGVTLLSAIPSQGTCGEGSCNLGTLPAGVSATVTLQTRVSPSAPEGPVSAQATVTSSTPDPNTGNNTVTISTTIQTQADLALFLEDQPDPVVAGRSLLYRLTMVNSGPSDARNVRLTLTLPAEITLESFSPATCVESGNQIRCDIDPLPAQGTFIMAITTTIPSDLPEGMVLIAQAEGSSDTADPDMTNNTRVASTAVALEADLQVALTGDPELVFLGDVVTYTLAITNTGPSSASGVRASLNLPSSVRILDVQPSQGTCDGEECDLGSLGLGGTATVRWQVHVTQWPGPAVTVRAIVSGRAVDPNPGENEAVVTTTVRFRVFLPMIYR